MALVSCIAATRMPGKSASNCGGRCEGCRCRLTDQRPQAVPPRMWRIAPCPIRLSSATSSMPRLRLRQGRPRLSGAHRRGARAESGGRGRDRRVERSDARGGRRGADRAGGAGERAREAATRSSGPRFFHFVMGGGTPAALGADWLTSAYDQVAFAWASSPFAARLEQVAIDWLRQLFELPAEFGGVLTTGATMANFVAWPRPATGGRSQGVDVEQDGRGEGCRRRDPVQRLSASERRPGGRDARPRSGQHPQLARDEVGRLDLVALERELETGGRRRRS